MSKTKLGEDLENGGNSRSGCGRGGTLGMPGNPGVPPGERELLLGTDGPGTHSKDMSNGAGCLRSPCPVLFEVVVRVMISQGGGLDCRQWEDAHALVKYLKSFVAQVTSDSYNGIHERLKLDMPVVITMVMENVQMMVCHGRLMTDPHRCRLVEICELVNGVPTEIPRSLRVIATVHSEKGLPLSQRYRRAWETC